MNNCLNCNHQTKNPKFCSRSCSAIYNNKYRTLKPRPQKPKSFCKSCGEPIFKRKMYCDVCNKIHNPNIVDWSTITLDELNYKRNYQKNSRIRDLARKKYYKFNSNKKCIICKYDKTIHVCHIKPIKTFPGNTQISVINKLSNLVYLCPNHHWELDNGLLSPLDFPEFDHLHS